MAEVYHRNERDGKWREGAGRKAKLISLKSLAQITLSEEEREQAAEDLEKMLGLIGKLEELDTEGVEPMSHVLPVQNVFREDLEGEGGDRRCSVPSGRDGMFVVPRTFQ